MLCDAVLVLVQGLTPLKALSFPATWSVALAAAAPLNSITVIVIALNALGVHVTVLTPPVLLGRMYSASAAGEASLTDLISV